MPESAAKVGQQLKRRRQAKGLSLTEVELQTKIRGKYLTALEAGNYDELPNDIYGRGFVQNYANFLGLDGAEIAAAYAVERGGLAPAQTKAPSLDRPPRLVVTGRVATVIGITAAALAIISYLLFQFSVLAAPPTISVTSPNQNQTVTGSVITVSGKVTPGASVGIDAIGVTADADGNFRTQVTLQNGVNTLRIVAKSQLGKTTTLTRTVLAKIPASTTNATVPTAPFNGIAILIKVNAITSVIVKVDGQQQYSGPFLAGTSRLFQGSSDISITTSNAGATSLTITNSTVAGKVIPKLGNDGEVRQNQDFTSTTQFP